jgi:hypothetical protein
MLQFSDEFLAKWEHIIDEVVKTDVPLECIKKIIIKLDGRRQRTINLYKLRQQGLDNDDLESVLTRTLDGLGDEIIDIAFVVDIGAVAELVQPETDKLLSNLK